MSLCSWDAPALPLFYLKFLDAGTSNKAALDLRTIGGATRLQRVDQQFEAILPPEHHALQHIGGRTEDVGRKCILAVLFINLADLVSSRALHQLLARKGGIVGQLDQRPRVREVDLVFPYCSKGAAQERIGVAASLDGRDHETIGQPRVEGPVCRLQVEIQAALVAPALQFDHAIALPNRVTLQ